MALGEPWFAGRTRQIMCSAAVAVAAPLAVCAADTVWVAVLNSMASPGPNRRQQRS